MFLTGHRNPFDFKIKKIPRVGGDKFKLVRKESNISFTRNLDSYLTKVDTSNDAEPIIRIATILNKNIISIKIDPIFKDLSVIGTDEEKEDVENFINHRPVTLYITKQNNPYHLLKTIVFSPKELFDKDALGFEFDAGLDLSHSSVYTKKIVSSYGYKIMGRKE